jgi:hypothetical protein
MMTNCSHGSRKIAIFFIFHFQLFAIEHSIDCAGIFLQIVGGTPKIAEKLKHNPQISLDLAAIFFILPV